MARESGLKSISALGMGRGKCCWEELAGMADLGDASTGALVTYRGIIPSIAVRL